MVVKHPFVPILMVRAAVFFFYNIFSFLLALIVYLIHLVFLLLQEHYETPNRAVVVRAIVHHLTCIAKAIPVRVVQQVRCTLAVVVIALLVQQAKHRSV